MQLHHKQLVVLNNSKNNYKLDLQLFALHGNIYSCNPIDLTTNEWNFIFLKHLT
jgi:hypothetical protein